MSEDFALKIAEKFQKVGEPFAVDGYLYKLDYVGCTLRLFRREQRVMWSWICDGNEILSCLPKPSLGQRIREAFTKVFDSFRTVR